MSTSKLEINYLPPGPITRSFLESHAFVRGIRGPVGSGKSTACVADIIGRICKQAPGYDGVRRSRWAVIRNTYPELKTTTIATWHQIVSRQIGRWVDQGPPTHHLVSDDLDAEVLFLALDSPRDVKKLLSLDLTGAWINEAREVPRVVLDTLTGRVGRYPSKAKGGLSWFGVIMDTNPPDMDQWWYRLAEEERPDGFKFFAQPSGLKDGENVANLPPGYYQRLTLGKSEDWIKVYVHGEYGLVSDGKPVQPDYRDGLHCKPVRWLAGRPLVVGLDFGLTPAAAYTQMALNGQWRCLGELCGTDIGVVRFAEVLARDIQQRFPGAQCEFIGDPAGGQRDADERTVFDILRARGIVARPAPSNEASLRREALGGALRRLVDGEPGFVVDPSASMIRKGLAGMFRYRRLQVAGGERYEDRVDKNEWSHPCEALEYALLGGGENARIPRGHQPAAGPIHVRNDWKVFRGR